MTITLDAPIKINLALHVVGQAANGYHQLQTLVVFAAMGDRISVAASRQDEVIIDGAYGHGLCSGRDNLIIKARDALRACVGGAAFPVRLHLTKNLPLASGLGGGSADGAATLLALSQIWRRNEEILDDLAKKLGADVPMCLHALQQRQALLATGIGDQIEPLPDFPALDMVIVHPKKPLSTAAVFAALSNKNNAPFDLSSKSRPNTEQLIQALKSMRNDLYAPACTLMPEIRHIMEKLQQTGAALTRMSGSGASCFGIYASQCEAELAAASLKQHNPDYFVQSLRTMGKE